MPLREGLAHTIAYFRSRLGESAGARVLPTGAEAPRPASREKPRVVAADVRSAVA